MAELEHMIAEVHEWRLFHPAQFQHGIKGAAIEAAPCDIREIAFRQARDAILRERNINGQ
jgi:hypothetical protein